jgi:hypothetical protein
MLVFRKKSPESFREVVDDFVSFRHNFGDLLFQCRDIARKRVDEVPRNNAQRFLDIAVPRLRMAAREGSSLEVIGTMNLNKRSSS